MSEKISPELDYSPVVSNHSTVVYRNIAPQGVNALTTSQTSTVGPTEFIIPPSCFRFDKSRLNFSMVLAAPAVKANFLNANTLTAISRITLYDSATNALWADISNVNQYASLVVPAATDFTEYSTKNFLAGTVPADTTDSRKNTVEDISKCNISTVNDTGDNVDMAAQNPFFSRRQFYIKAVTVASSIDVSIPLSAFKLSVLASDKLMYCPSNLVLQVYWNSNNNYAFVATAVTDPSDGAASLAAPIELTNISLTLANEGNLAIVSQVINKVMTSGISLPIAYPTVTRQVISTATSHSYQLSLTRGYGNRILAVITAPFHTTNSLNTANVHSRSTLSTYNTFLNNVAIKSQSGFDATKSQDFIVGNREYLEGSVIQTIGEYLNGEWVHIDSFFGEKPLKDVNQHEVDGLDVGAQSSTWQIQANTSGNGTAFNWCSIIIGQKQLSVSNQGSLVQ
jgi:hypothetical protein